MSDNKELTRLFNKYNIHYSISQNDKANMQRLCTRVCGCGSGGMPTIMLNGQPGIHLGGCLAIGFDGKIGISLVD